MNKLRNSKDFFFYGISFSLKPIISILILPLVTIRIEPVLYGNYTYFVSILGLLSVIFFSWIIASVVRFLNKESEHFNIDMITIYKISKISIILYFVTFLILLFFIKNITFIFVFANLILLDLMNLVLGYYKTNGNSKKFAIHNIRRTVLNTIVLLVMFYIGINSVVSLFIGDTVYNLIFIIVIFFKLKKRTSLPSSSSLNYKKLLNFGLPLIGLGLSGSLLNNGDRLVIKNILDNGSFYLGIYSINYNIYSRIITIIIMSIMSLLPSRLYPLYERKGLYDYLNELKKYLMYFLIIATTLNIFLLFNYSNINYLLLNNSYTINSNLPILLSTAYIFFGMYQVVANYFIVEKKTMYVNYFIVIAAIVNILLNIIFIPRIGFQFAALSTLFAFLLNFILAYIFVLKKSKTSLLNFGHIILIVLNLIILCFSFIYKHNFKSDNNILIIKSILLSFISICLIAFGIYHLIRRLNKHRVY